jgi:hypothetical protein
MGRYRARNSDPIERDVQKNIAEAERYLKRALSALSSVRGNPSIRKARYNQLEQTLKESIRVLSSTPRLTHAHDKNDPDLNPQIAEEQRKKRLERKRGEK